MAVKSKILQLTLLLTFLLVVSVHEGAARGGRGRGGGSFGGLFGSWRKYKKPSSSSNSRRTVSGSAMPPPVSKPISNNNNNNPSFPNLNKPPPSYPKQEMPSAGGAAGYRPQYGSNGGYGSYGSYGSYGAAGTPPGGQYYASAAAMPPGAIYMAQPPRSSGAGDMIFGMLAGHMISRSIYGSYPHVSHIYHQAQQPNSEGKVIIINNGGNATETSGTTTPPMWPTDGAVPLAQFNDSVTPAEAQASGNTPVFDGSPYTTQVPSTNSDIAIGQSAFVSDPPPSAVVPPQFTGIICVPVLLSKPDPNDPEKTIPVQETVCYPAPPPSPPHAYDPLNPEAIGSTENVAGDIGETTPNTPTADTPTAITPTENTQTATTVPQDN